MSEIKYIHWKESVRRLMDYARREVLHGEHPKVITDRLQDEVRIPLKTSDVVIIATKGSAMVGYATGILLDEGITITSIVVSPSVDRLNVTPQLVFSVINQLSRKGSFKFIQIEVPCINSDYITASLRPYGFMVFPQLEMCIINFNPSPEKHIPGVSLDSWRVDTDNEASLVIAISDLGEGETKRDIQEREPRQRWLEECRLLSGGELDENICHQAFIGNEMIGMVVGLIRDRGMGRIEGIGVISERSRERIEKALVERSLLGFKKKKINLVRTVIPMVKKKTIALLESIGFTSNIYRPDLLLLSSDQAWDDVCKESINVTLES